MRSLMWVGMCDYLMIPANYVRLYCLILDSTCEVIYVFEGLWILDDDILCGFASAWDVLSALAAPLLWLLWQSLLFLCSDVPALPGQPHLRTPNESRTRRFGRKFTPPGKVIRHHLTPFRHCPGRITGIHLAFCTTVQGIYLTYVLSVNPSWYTWLCWLPLGLNALSDTLEGIVCSRV